MYCRSRVILSAALFLSTMSPLQQVSAGEGERQTENARYSGVSRVYAVGDVHGAYTELVDALQRVPLIDDDARWSGGDAHLVMLGDLLDRGDDSRKVLDLLMRLQNEARAAGGRVHVVMGNHEVMNIVGDLRYVSEGEFASYLDMEDKNVRARAAKGFRRARHGGKRLSRRAAAKLFKQMYPPGFFGHRKAMSLDGPYGKWLVDLPLMIIINRTAFVHAGILPVMGEMGVDELNARFRSEILYFLHLRDELIDVGLLDEETTYAESHMVIQDRLEEVGKRASSFKKNRLISLANRFMETSSAMPFDGRGPVWYRGTAKNDQLEREILAATLAQLDVDRVAIGHTATAGHLAVERFDGMVLMMDTGMLREVYNGQSSVLEIVDGALRVFYPATGKRSRFSTEAEAVALAARATQLPDKELEQWLRTATVVESKRIGRGVTKSKKLTLEKDGKTGHAIFKTIDEEIQREVWIGKHRMFGFSDNYRYDVAAYRLDRLLGANMVPVTVLREIDGKSGSLQEWIEGAVDEEQRRTSRLNFDDPLRIAKQQRWMRVFDALIFNIDRNQTNMLYSVGRWRLFLIDHSRSFRLERRLPPRISESVLALEEEEIRRLESLTIEKLENELGALISPARIRSIIARRDLLLEIRRAPAASD